MVLTGQICNQVDKCVLDVVDINSKWAYSHYPFRP